MTVLWTVLASTLGHASPPQGEPLRVRRGLFAETDIGVFAAIGGRHQISNAQTYLQLGVGYDLTERLEIAATFGLGASAANCFSAINALGLCNFSDNFTVTFINATAAYLFQLVPRLYLSPKATAGYTKMDPAPAARSSGGPIRENINVGLGAGVEYATYLDHFSIGADLLVRYVPGPNLYAATFFPRVKYTF
jgi:hypothetical protein